MNQEQISLLKMAKAIINLFEQFVALWTGKVAVEESVNKTKAYVSGIDAASFEQVHNSTKGYTADKLEQRKLMITLALMIVSKIRPYAKRFKNSVLLDAVDFSETELSQIKDDLCIQRCKNILAAGREYLSVMTGYNLIAGDLDALEATIQPFIDLSSTRDVVLGDRVAATDRIEKQAPLLRQELDILDDLVKSHMPVEFQQTYQSLR